MQKVAPVVDILFIILLICMSFSCSNKDVEAPLTLFATPTTLSELPAQGGEVTFAVTTNAPKWEYTLSSDWLTEKAQTDTSLILKVSANPTDNQRITTITFGLSSLPNAKQSILLSQAKAQMPKADLIDLVFKTDGTADNIASESIKVTTLKGDGLCTAYNTTYNRHIARFKHTGTTISSGYYKIDYSSNQKLKEAIADGHTMETFCLLETDTPLPDQEIKMFSTHEGGGTGFLVGNHARNNSFVFLPHIGSGYVWTNSGVSPEKGRYYHIVGVWNKEEGKAFIYVDGVLKATENTQGNFNFPAATCQWFGIGADASPGGGETPWQGEVAIARLYDRPLIAKEIELLWNELKDLQPELNGIHITEISLTPKQVLQEGEYIIRGKGFKSGDKIKLESTSCAENIYICDGHITENHVTITIPKGFTSGEYRFFVVRDEKEMDLGFTTLKVVNKLPKKPKVIAHRGYWTTGSPQNSVAALKKAQEIGVYGAEFDLWITKDGKIVINHDDSINNLKIEEATFNQLKDIALRKGEMLSTLEDFLEQGKKDPSTRLILEIKTHKNAANNHRIVTETQKLVQASGIADQVEYIAFNIEICKKMLELQPDATVAYLGGACPPQQLNELGLHMDYYIETIRANKSWVAQMQDLGKTVNVWTVNTPGELAEMIELGVDFITTDYPELATLLIKNH
ncbi:glycerophosphoryl diester phosphodiesterase [Parabacteroides sp. PFB2-10]|uniref:glycerophosphodiester phosphodiesterase family protein n=1 Tax=Parabacteroides sp. PFB2-10 TaxID=1742405 RepID=UPI002476DE8D|nr:glycerophosphodiester phosphodiesterase family protein [Parabacteroides sp. PFB2-10]MDH6312409.1 glycerophosphoryl diester phosphodiesterase [Parabacteroides sp. PFB2-10]